jgi:hypothetical protein
MMPRLRMSGDIPPSTPPYAFMKRTTTTLLLPPYTDITAEDTGKNKSIGCAPNVKRKETYFENPP